jgi:ribosomal protein L21E
MTIMAKPKKKLTPAQRAAKKQRKKDFMTVFMNGKQVRVRRPPTTNGMPEEEFIRLNADPIWLHQHGCYEILHERAEKEN